MEGQKLVSKRDKLREATLGSPAIRSEAIVKWNGQDFAVRRPSIKTQRQIDSLSTDKKGRKDGIKALLHALIKCIYVPGSDELVFEATDFDAMEDRGTEDFVGTFAKAIGELSTEVEPEEIEKNSASAPSAATS